MKPVKVSPMNKEVYSIAKDFTRKPGLRYKWQSDNSGEEFLEEVLLLLFDRIVKENKILEINLDNTFGYGPSFLEEAFGGLARKRNKFTINKHVTFISEEEPYLIDEIKEYISNAVAE